MKTNRSISTIEGHSDVCWLLIELRNALVASASTEKTIKL